MFRWSRRTNGPKSARSRRARLLVQGLEGRDVPATFTVLNIADTGPGSLRQAVLNANAAGGADVINFDPTIFNTPYTILLSPAAGQLTITGDTTIDGPGASQLTVSGGNVTRVFNVDGPGTLNVTLRGMTVTGGNGSNGGVSFSDGGGVRCADENLTLENMAVTNNTAGFNDGGGVAMALASTSTLTVRNSTVSGNTARNGGGLYTFNGGGLRVENSAITQNGAFGTGVVGGGGIYFFGAVAAGGFSILNSTISGNGTQGSGGGILLRSFSGAPGVANSTITNNTAGAGDTTAGSGGGGIALQLPQAGAFFGVASSIVSGNGAVNNGRHDIAAATANVNVNFSAIGSPAGFTLSGTSFGNLPFGTQLNLLPLADNGGPTQTIALAGNSPAIGAGSNFGGLTTDQRGPNFPRAVNFNVDIGAFEYAPPPSVTLGPLPAITGGTTYDFTVTYGGATPINVATIDGMDVRVFGPSGFNQLATLVGIDQAGNGTPRTATYRINAPGGFFDSDDNGVYLVQLQGGQVVTVEGGTNPLLQLGTVQVAIPARFTVTNLDNAGPGTLRQAILDANANNDPDLQDIINFLAGLTGTINLTSPLAITQSVAINGPGAGALVVSGGNAVRVFNVDGPGRLPVRLSGLSISGGSVAGDGGGIFEADEDLTLDRVTLTGNRTTGAGSVANSGGGIAVGSGGWLTVRNSTISGNQAGAPGNTFAAGGGIYFFDGGSLLMENSTITGNAASGDRGGGGIYFFGAPTASGVTIRNSTIANNTAPSGAGLSFVNLNTAVAPVVVQSSTITGNFATTNSTTPGYGGGGIAIPIVANGATAVLSVESTVVSGNAASFLNGRDDIAVPAVARVNLNFSAVGVAAGFVPSNTSGNNLPFGLPLGLGSLGNNGGTTLTIAIAENSPLRNAGTNPAGLTFDQRGPGFARVSGVAADIGAFEFQNAVPAPQVVGVGLNAGQANATQRSRVTSITVTFNAAVTFAGSVASAFGLSRIGGGAVGGFTAAANVVNGVTVVTLTGFTGTETQFGSLADGRYALLVRANQVTAGGQQLDGDGNGAGGDDFTLNGSAGNGLYRLFGDANGDGVVNAFDFSQFRNAFGSSTGQAAYVDWLDINGDGTINAFDFGQFRPRFGSGVP